MSKSVTIYNSRKARLVSERRHETKESAKMSMITATTWVPRGRAAQFPTKYEFDEEEYDRISRLARLQLDDAKDELEEARETAGKAKESGNRAQKETAVVHQNESVRADMRAGARQSQLTLWCKGMSTTTTATTTTMT